MSKHDLPTATIEAFSSEDASLLFVAESRDLLRDMERALLTLEQAPRDAEAVNAVFRAMHTIKGSSGAFGFDVIVEFTHVLEGVIVKVRSGELSVNAELLAVLLDCGDHLCRLIDCLEGADRMARLEAARGAGSQLLARLDRIGRAESSPESAANGAWHISVRFGREVLSDGMDPLSFIRYLSTLGQVLSVSALFDAMPDADAMDPQACYVGLEIRFSGAVDRPALEGVFEYVRDNSAIRILPPHAPLADYLRLIEEVPEGAARMGELLVESGCLTPGELERATGLRSGSGEPGAPDPGLQQAAGIPASAPAPRAPAKPLDTRSIRVGAAKLDNLIDLLGELVIASAGVSLGAQRAGSMELREAAATMSRLVEEVRDGALTLRMVPIGDTFNRFQRVVHDMGRALGKDVELVIHGAETELDKSMVEKLSDPLVHLVRNALDHGIETAERRRLAGKPSRGQLLLNAYHDTGSIVIEVVDDGAGLDREKILARALERNLVTEGQTLSDHDLFQFVMEPGFSTAAAPTSVSGRGIGMDVVRRNIEALRGSVTIDSVARQGTTMALRVPLTLAIIDGFLVGVGRATYVAPLGSVVECMQLARDDAARMREAGYLNLRGKVLPLLRLRDVFETAGEPAKRENVVVVDYGGQQAGLVVDALLGEFQTVIKPLGKLFDRLAGISGSTILGSGEVALILDVPALVQRAVPADFGRGRPDKQGRSICSTS
jgi:two-component system, chemotaxis family, sensor kinase CheA